MIANESRPGARNTAWALPLVGWIASVVAGPLSAQTVDWARFNIGIQVGVQSGTSLWQVADQPIVSGVLVPGNPPRPLPPARYNLRNDVQSGFSMAIHATRFWNEHVGLNVELTYLGLKAKAGCKLAFDDGDPDLEKACTLVGSSQKFGAGITPGLGSHDAKGSNQTGSTTLIQAGLMIRPFRPGQLQPFVNLSVGFADVPHSTIAVESVYGAIADTALSLTIYQDYDWKPIRPEFTVGAGLNSAPSHGLQVHVEVRETFLPLLLATGPTTTQNQQPPPARRGRDFRACWPGSTSRSSCSEGNDIDVFIEHLRLNA